MPSPPIPSISITPAPPETDCPEPCSLIPSENMDVDDDGYRAKWLSVPPFPNAFPWRSSSLRPAGSQPHEGLSPDRFDSLRNLSRDQRARLGKHQSPDLRKELALRNQGLKQLERRALFLSKVKEPIFTSERCISEGPLKSLGTAHCTVSPHVFEPEVKVAEENTEGVAHVNFPVKLGWNKQAELDPLISKNPLGDSKAHPAMSRRSRRTVPSLDEITARLKPMHISSEKHCSRSRLPNFLETLRQSPSSTGDQIKTIPVRTLAVNDEKFDTSFSRHAIPSQRPNLHTLKLGSEHALAPRTVDIAAGSTVCTRRADTAREMIVTLRRRRSPPPGLDHHECTQTSITVKRRSAPAQL